mgnify:CR=1 FL=1
MIEIIQNEDGIFVTKNEYDLETLKELLKKIPGNWEIGEFDEDRKTITVSKDRTPIVESATDALIYFFEGVLYGHTMIKNESK